MFVPSSTFKHKCKYMLFKKKTKGAESLTVHTYKLHQVSFSQQPVWLTSLTRSATCTYISTAAADLHSSLYLLPGFPFVPAVSHQLSRGGEGSGKGWFIQGSSVPCLVPSLLIPDSLPEAHDLFQPQTPAALCGFSRL